MIKMIKPYWIFGVGSLILLVLGFLSNSNSAIDVQLYDAYIVIPESYFYYILGLAFLLIALVYYGLKEVKLNRRITIIHTVFTLLTLAIFFFSTYRLTMFSSPRRYYSFGREPLYDTFDFWIQTMSMSLVVFTLCQLLLPLSYVFRDKKVTSRNDTLLDN